MNGINGTLLRVRENRIIILSEVDLLSMKAFMDENEMLIEENQIVRAFRCCFAFEKFVFNLALSFQYYFKAMQSKKQECLSEFISQISFFLWNQGIR